MIIEIESQADSRGVDELLSALSHPFRACKVMEVRGRKFVVVSGDRSALLPGQIQRDFEIVRHATSNDAAGYFCRREFSEARSLIPLGARQLGGDELLLIAGPCTVEGKPELLETAWALKEAGAHALRAGAFKPRTSPYNFQGLGARGVELLREVADEVGMPVVSEILDAADIAAANELVDVIQVGARNMTNQGLLKALGRSAKPVLIKRGAGSKLEELVRAGEFVFVEGNPRIAFCERGIQTFETVTRFTFDVSAVPVLRTLTHCPVVADPSHAAGDRRFVTPLAVAAAAVGVDALLLEAHVRPEMMIRPGDDKQALRIGEFESLVRDVSAILHAQGRKLAAPL